MTIEPKVGFDWTRVRWTGPYAPVDETCSYCGAAIPDEHVPLRMWNEASWAAVFCHACMATWWGMSMLEDDPNDVGDERGIDDDDPLDLV
jgi:hypothetical protein